MIDFMILSVKFFHLRFEICEIWARFDKCKIQNVQDLKCARFEICLIRNMRYLTHMQNLKYWKSEPCESSKVRNLSKPLPYCALFSTLVANEIAQICQLAFRSTARTFARLALLKDVSIVLFHFYEWNMNISVSQSFVKNLETPILLIWCFLINSQ